MLRIFLLNILRHKRSLTYTRGSYLFVFPSCPGLFRHCANLTPSCFSVMISDAELFLQGATLSRDSYLHCFMAVLLARAL